MLMVSPVRRYHLQQNPVDAVYSKRGRSQTASEPHYLELKWKPEVRRDDDDDDDDDPSLGLVFTYTHVVVWV
jgi:hypothetical protein